MPLSDKLNPNIPTTGALVVSPRIRPLPVPHGHIPRENQLRERGERGEEGGEELAVSSWAEMHHIHREEVCGAVSMQKCCSAMEWVENQLFPKNLKKISHPYPFFPFSWLLC